MRLINLKPGTVDKETVRELAVKLRLPPRLKDSKIALGVAAGIFAIISVAPTVATVAALGGAAISIAAAFWDKPLPRTISRLRWLAWALEWRIG
jgi:hypothetical protein